MPTFPLPFVETFIFYEFILGKHENNIHFNNATEFLIIKKRLEQNINMLSLISINVKNSKKGKE